MPRSPRSRLAALLEPEEEEAVPARASDLVRDGRERLVLAPLVLEALDADRHLVGLAIEDAAHDGAHRGHARIARLRRRGAQRRVELRRGVARCGRFTRGLPEAHAPALGQLVAELLDARDGALREPALEAPRCARRGASSGTPLFRERVGSP
jgi:hypothetical protein